MGKFLRIVILFFLGVKWFYAYEIWKDPGMGSACFGGFLSASLGAAAASSNWWVVPALLLDLGIVATLFSDLPDRDDARNFALGYFGINVAAMIFATYGTSYVVSMICGMASFLVVAPIAIFAMTMTFWLPPVIYVAIKFTSWR